MGKSLIQLSKDFELYMSKFDLSQLGIEKEVFCEAMNPYFENLSWDMYEFNFSQYKFLSKCYKEDAKILIILDDFIQDCFLAEFDSEKFYKLIENLPSDQYRLFSSIKPRRKRAIAYYSVLKEEDELSISLEKHKPFYQSESGSYPDYRSFDELQIEVSSHDFVITILKYFSDKIFLLNPKVEKISVNCHFVQAWSYVDYNGSNSPEGIHQDGMDYIISALVVDRKNIEGGFSKLYYPDINHEIYSSVLNKGEGLFHQDVNTNLWHCLSDMKLNNREEPGYRNSIGFDFMIT